MTDIRVRYWHRRHSNRWIPKWSLGPNATCAVRKVSDSSNFHTKRHGLNVHWDVIHIIIKGDRDITKNNFKRIGKRNKIVKTVRLLLSSICLQYRKLSWNHPHWRTCSFELAWLIILILSRRKMAWDYHICTVVVVVVFDFRIMMTSSNGNIFHVTGHLCGEFTGPRWIPPTKTSDAELWCFLWSASE